MLSLAPVGRFQLKSLKLTHREVLLLLGALVIVGLTAQLALADGDFRVDDAYITFSFSKNLALGNGPVFSWHERVEGYSNFLWMLLTALPLAFAPNLDPYVPARVMTFASLGLLYVITYRMARLHAGRFTSFIAVALLATCSDVVRGAMSGLETVPFVTAVALGWYKYLTEPRAQRRWSLLWFAPVVLLRIDGFVPALVLIAFEVASSYAQREFSLHRTLRWIAPLAALWGVYFAWRYAYYGLPLPTTYYAKSMVTVGHPGIGTDTLWRFTREYGVIALLPLMLLPLARGPKFSAYALWAAVACQVAYVARVGGDWMPFSRFLMPVVPLGAVLSGWGLEQAYNELRALPEFGRWLGRVGLLAPLTFSAVHMLPYENETGDEVGKMDMVRHVKKHTKETLLDSLDLLRPMVRTPGDRLVTDYAGVFAYYLDAAIIDQWGLCNADTALNGTIEGIHAVYGKQCPDCVQRADPDYFHIIAPLVRSKDAFADANAVAKQVFLYDYLDRHVKFADNYTVGRVIESTTGRTLWFMERRRPNRSLTPRAAAPGIVVDYPFG